MGQCIWGCKDDDGTARPADAPLPYRGNRQRQLPLQKQFNSIWKGGQKQETIHNVNRSEIDLGWVRIQCKWWVRFKRNSTTVLATAQPKTVILSLFKIAVRVKQYKDRVLLHLPSACPVKALLETVCGRLYPHNSRMRSMLASP